MLKRTDQYTDKRFYYDTETRKFYISATTFCSYVLPENPYLTKWKQELGTFEANRRVKEAAHYGTLLHILIENFVATEVFTKLRMDTLIEQYLEMHQITDNLRSWEKELKKDMLSFAQFAFDKEIELIASEEWVIKDINEYGGIAGTIDLIVDLTFNKVRRRALVDVKSGRKGFFPSSELQLCLYREIIEEPETMLFNWSPKDWDKTPTYELKNQTGSKMGDKLQHYIKIAAIDGMFEPKYKFIDFDYLSIGVAPQFEVRTLEEMMG